MSNYIDNSHKKLFQIILTFPNVSSNYLKVDVFLSTCNNKINYIYFQLKKKHPLQ